MRNYAQESPPARFAFDQREFPVKQGDEVKTETARGATCNAVYLLKDGADALSDVEIQANYRDQLAKAEIGRAHV